MTQLFPTIEHKDEIRSKLDKAWLAQTIRSISTSVISVLISDVWQDISYEEKILNPWILELFDVNTNCIKVVVNSKDIDLYNDDWNSLQTIRVWKSDDLEHKIPVVYIYSSIS